MVARTKQHARVSTVGVYLGRVLDSQTQSSFLFPPANTGSLRGGLYVILGTCEVHSRSVLVLEIQRNVGEPRGDDKPLPRSVVSRFSLGSGPVGGERLCDPTGASRPDATCQM